MSDTAARIFAETFDAHRSELRSLRNRIHALAIRRGLDPAYRIRVQVHLLKFSYCLCTAEFENPLFIGEAETDGGLDNDPANVVQDAAPVED